MCAGLLGGVRSQRTHKDELCYPYPPDSIDANSGWGAEAAGAINRSSKLPGREIGDGEKLKLIQGRSNCVVG